MLHFCDWPVEGTAPFRKRALQGVSASEIDTLLAGSLNWTFHIIAQFFFHL